LISIKKGVGKSVETHFFVNMQTCFQKLAVACLAQALS